MVIVKKCEIYLTREEGNFILKSLKEKKIKIKDLCKKYGYTKTMFYYYIHGKTRLSDEVIKSFIENGIKIPVSFATLKDLLNG